MYELQQAYSAAEALTMGFHLQHPSSSSWQMILLNAHALRNYRQHNFIKNDQLKSNSVIEDS